MKSNMGIIISREFRERVVKKSFIITTILTPLLLVLFMAAPALLMSISSPSEKRIAVVDPTGIVWNDLQAECKDVDYLTVERSALPVDSLLQDERFDGVFTVGADIVKNPSNASLYTHDAGSLDTESIFNNAVNNAVETERLKDYNIENLDEILESVKVDAHIKTFRVDENGEEESVSTAVSFFIGMAMTFILYMFLTMYGQMVMTSIIEEKNNRVLELVVSSVKPVQLMLGKIIGVGLVAVMQIVIWAALLCVFGGFLLPVLMPESMMEQVSMFNAGTFNASSTSLDPDMVKALAMFTSVGFIAKLFGYILLFMVGGFLFYASIFAAIGSGVDNVQDASQLQTFALLPILIAFIFSMSIGTDPNSTAAVWLSMIPFTSPMVMLSRIPFDIPGWQVWVSVVVLYLSFVGMAWIAGKIYRVGIFMYGKKPTFKDLIRWARYK